MKLCGVVQETSLILHEGKQGRDNDSDSPGHNCRELHPASSLVSMQDGFKILFLRVKHMVLPLSAHHLNLDAGRTN